jgi:hypothetical protein
VSIEKSPRLEFIVTTIPRKVAVEYLKKFIGLSIGVILAFLTFLGVFFVLDYV